MNNTLDYRGIQERLNSLLEHFPRTLSDKIIRAIPIVAPVLNIRWRVLETHIEPVGMMERNILKAISIVGPATVEELDDLLQLDVHRINRVLSKLSNLGAPIRQIANKYELIMPASEVETMLDIRREVVHEREFVFSGLCERLLPVRFWEDHEELQLFLANGDNGQLIDATGTETMVRHILKPITNDGRQAIEELLCNDDISSRELSGLPAGMSSLAEDLPVNRETTWVLCFLLIMLDGRTRLFSASGKPCEFELPGYSHSDWLTTACLTLNATDISVKWFPEKLTEQKLFAPWPEQCRIVPETTTVYISLDSPDTELRLPDNMLNNVDEAGDKAAWYCRSLIFGKCWSGPPQFVLLRVMPGNIKTAIRVCVLSAALALRRYVLFEQRLSPGDLREWWDCYSKDFFSKKNSDLPTQLKFADVIKEAKQIQDTEFQEKLSVIEVYQDPIAGKKDKMVQSAVLANIPGREITLGNQILLLIRTAKQQLLLISPMVADERLINAIVCARNRGVEVRLLTELINRKHGKLKFPTKGFEFEPEHSLNCHFENVRKLVSQGVFCRSMNYYAHAKLVFADSNAAIVSSANLSSNSLGWGIQPACEAGVLITESVPLNHLNNLFKGLWESSPYQMHSRLGDTELVEEKGADLSAELLRQTSDGCHIVVSTPPGEFKLLDDIVAACGRASESILFTCMSCYEISEIPVLLKTLKKAIDNGIMITLVVRKGFWGEAVWPDKGLDNLHRSGMRIKCISNLHVKGLVVDDKEVGLFSANLNPYSLNYNGASAHVEIGVFGRTDEPLWRNWFKFLVKLSEEADEAFVINE